MNQTNLTTLIKHTPNSLADILQWRSKNQPERLAYRFLKDGEKDEVRYTYEELDRRARSIGARLQAHTNPGERAFLLLPSGLDFLAAFFGCLYANVIAIPVIPPHQARLEKTLQATLRIAANAQPSVALLTASLAQAIQANPSVQQKFSRITLLPIDTEETHGWADKWEQPHISGEDTAFLQYTSGSTTTPKGVMVSHGNLLHNLDLIRQSLSQTTECHGVIWLPPYHDMGLIGGILQPLYTGYPVTLMPHLMFLQRPIRWLQAISQYKCTSSGGPNFAYDLCLRKIKPEQRDQLDLSTWDVAFNGAEQIYHKTLDEFAAYFAPCGFRKEAFLSCYGLAEATLMVVGGPKSRPPRTLVLTKSGLKQNQAIIASASDTDSQTLVSCGQNLLGQDIKIVNPETLTVCPPDEIGEIWINGPSVAHGYWKKPKATASTFGAHIAGSEGGPFLRTGDLGFFKDDELYITGRLKNLIIVGGKNHHPHDIERTASTSHPAIRPAGCAVFPIENSGSEDVVIIAEVQHRQISNTTEVTKAIRKAVAEHHELHVYDIKLCLPGGIPRTTSGKIRHFLCKTHYLAGTLKEITLT